MNNRDIKKWYLKQSWYNGKDIEYENSLSLHCKNIKVALLVANEIEFKYLINLLIPLKNHIKILRYTRGCNEYYIGILGVNDVIVVKPEKIGVDASIAALTHLFDQENNIQIVISVGIAAGIKQNVSMHIKEGDILISSKIGRYGDIRAQSGEIIPRGPVDTVDHDIVSKFNGYEVEFRNIHNRNPKKICGCILSGPLLVDDKKTVGDLLKHPSYKNAIGLEMEGGINVLVESNNKKFIIVKGISDWAANKNKIYQPLAAHTSALLVRKVLSEHYFSSIKIEDNSKININSLKVASILLNLKLKFEEVPKKCNITIDELKDILSVNLDTGSYGKENFPFVSHCFLNRLIESLNINDIGDNFIASGIQDFTWTYVNDYWKFVTGKNSIITVKQSSIDELRKTKAVIFDFDGTITKHNECKSTWEELWKKLGYDVELCRNYAEKYYSNSMTHKEWCDITCDHFKKQNCSIDHINQVASNINIVKGTVELIRDLYENGIYLYLLSGSIDFLIRQVLKNNNILEYFTEIISNRFILKRNKLENIIGNNCDFEHKSELINKKIEELNILPSQLLFVGNSHNDEHACKSGCHTLCVNPYKTNADNKSIWHDHIDEMYDMCNIKKYIY